MKRTYRLLIALLLGILVALPALALADGSVSGELNVPQHDITVGDVVPVTVTVTHPQGWRVLVPALNKTWGDLTVRAAHAPQISANADGTETTTETIDVSYFRPGAVTVPALDVNIADTQGQLHPVTIQPVSLKVKSVLTPDDQKLRDIKPQAELWQFGTSPVPFVASVALAFTLLGGATVWAWQHRPSVDKRTPRQRALDDLKAIESSNLLASGDVKTYCIRLSSVLREYLDKGCHLAAPDLTTNELAQALKTQPIPQQAAAEIVRVLRVCDSAKFAGDAADLDTLKTLPEIAQQIVLLYPPAPTGNKNGKR